MKSQLINTHIPFTKNMSNTKLYFSTVIKTNIISNTKHPSKHSTNQDKVTFQSDIKYKVSIFILTI